MSKYAVVFPGQGSQSVGMLAELAERFPVIKETFQEASETLGYDLWSLVQDGPIEELNQTNRTQPALLTASVALWRLWQSQDRPVPTFLAGHSLGEYSALVCAGVIEFKDAVKLVELRGLLMQAAVPSGEGAMSAIIGLSDELIQKACVDASKGQVVSPVNFNSPGQVVIAGNKDAVERANVLCKEAGAKRALPLPVSVPSHCALMKPAADELAKALDGLVFTTPSIPVLNNVNVKAETDPKAIKEALVLQLFNPVRWTECVQKLAQEDITTLVELGPGNVLCGLVKRIDKSITAFAANDLASIDKPL